MTLQGVGGLGCGEIIALKIEKGNEDATANSSSGSYSFGGVLPLLLTAFSDGDGSHDLELLPTSSGSGGLLREASPIPTARVMAVRIPKCGV